MKEVLSSYSFSVPDCGGAVSAGVNRVRGTSKDQTLVGNWRTESLQDLSLQSRRREKKGDREERHRERKQ